MRGFGTVATGTLTSGRLAVDDALEVMPGGRDVKVRGVQVHGARRQAAVAGERVAVNLTGVEVADLVRGQALVTPGTLPATSVIDVVITVLPSAPAAEARRARAIPPRHRRDPRARLDGRARRSTASRRRSRRPAPGVARLRLETPAAVTRGDRFVLRSYSPSVTIAGGRVLDPAPPRARRAGRRHTRAAAATRRAAR